MGREVWRVLVQEAGEVSLLPRLGIHSQHPGAGEADGQAALEPQEAGEPAARTWGSAFRWPTVPPTRTLRSTPDGAHPPERDALSLGSLASGGSGSVLPTQGAQVQPQLGKIPQATRHGQKS